MRANNVKKISYLQRQKVLEVTYQGGTLVQYYPILSKEYEVLVVPDIDLSSMVHKLIINPTVVGKVINEGRDVYKD